jgi:hypothetical protein
MKVRILLGAPLFRGRLTGRTLGFEPGNKGSSPFSEANFKFQISDSRSKNQGVRRWQYGLFWKQVFAGSNPAALTMTISRRRSSMESERPSSKRKAAGSSPAAGKFHVRVAQLGRGACLRNKLMKVRILPRIPIDSFEFQVASFELTH